MDLHDTSDVAPDLKGPTAASVLGIKGELRFRPHGSTQKAHVVLRQVDWSPEDSEDEADSSMAYFSLFAQKRIEVKPGKEILLAVATPDGTFLDTPVILAGKSTGEDSAVDDRNLKVTERSTSFVLPNGTLPPKMRKTWSKRSTTQAHFNSASSRLYTSVGTQTGLPIPLHATATSAATQTGPPILPQETKAASLEEDSVSSGREKSLSPMELDSAPSSPSPPSPPPLPEAELPLPVVAKSSSFSPPGLWVSASPQPQPVVIQTNNFSSNMSAKGDDPRGPSLTLPPERLRPISPVRPILKPSGGAAENMVQSPSDMPVALPPRPEGAVAVLPTPVTAPPSSAVDPAHFAATVASSVISSAAPYVPKRKVLTNPFVSGGMLTDFVSSSAAKTAATASQATQRSASASASPDEIPGLSQLPANLSAAVFPLAADRNVDASPASPSSSCASRRSPVRKSLSPASSSSPSSSKVKVEDILPPPPPSQPQQSLESQAAVAYDPTRPDLQLPANPSRFPPMAMPNFPPNLVRAPPPALQWSNGYIPPTTRRYSPAPDPRSSAYVPTSSYSNPLGIRPALPGGAGERDRYADSAHTAAAPPSAAKKPVPIGSGWPRNRQANGHAPKSGQRPVLKPPASVGASLPSAPLAQSLSPIDGITSVALSNVPPVPPFAPKQTVQASELLTQPSYSTALPTLNTSNMVISNVHANGFGRASVASNISIHPSTSPTFVSASSNITSIRSNSTASPSHPLPRKPTVFSGPSGNWSPSMGVKRMGSPSLQSQSPDSRRSRSFNWPTSEAIYSLRLQSDEDVGIRMISHNSDGSLCAVTCFDKSVRILSTKTRTELAKLAHNMQVSSVAWMDRDAGIITLGENGIVSTWTRSAGNKWQWAKILDASAGRSDDEPGCLAFGRDRIAISYPRTGVKVWLFIKGTWLPQRSILRQNVTAIKFVEEGEALIGGTTDGVLWYCQVPNGTLRAYSFMKSKVYALDVDPRGSHALAAQMGGRSHLVSITQDDQKGKVEQVYAAKDPDIENDAAYDFGALFASRGQRLLFGMTRGCIMVWDRKTGDIVHGFSHGEDHTIQAVSCFDGSQAADGHIITGTRQGHLTWFSQPPG